MRSIDKIHLKKVVEKNSPLVLASLSIRRLMKVSKQTMMVCQEGLESLTTVSGGITRDMAKGFSKTTKISGNIEGILSITKSMDLVNIAGQVAIHTRDGLAIRVNQASDDILGLLMVVNILDTGKTTRKTVLESIFTQTRVSTSGIIIMIGLMDSEFTSGQMETFTRVNGRMGSEVV